MNNASERTFYLLQPILPLGEWWQWLAFAVALLAIIAFVVWMYRRDALHHSRGLTLLLATLRITALAALVLYILNPQLRSETQMVRTSRLAVVIDNSLSMGLKDNKSGTSQSSTPRRIDAVATAFQSQPTLAALQENHDITVYRFGDETQPEPIATFERTRNETESKPAIVSATEEAIAQLARARQLAIASAGLGILTLALFIVWIGFRFRGTLSEKAIGWLVAAEFCLIAAFVCVALCDLTASPFDLATSLGLKDSDSPSVIPAALETAPEVVSEEAPTLTPAEINWENELAPKGTSTKLGSAVQYLVNKERGGPIAGIVVITDGRNNSGLEPPRAIAAAANAGIPVYTVGIGSNESPMNLQIADIQAPSRVFPGDKFLVKGMVQAFGLSGKTVRVGLFSTDEQETESPTMEDEISVKLLDDGQAVPIDFEISRQKQGKRRYIIRAAEVDGDLDPRDNQRGTMVEIVERKSVILLIAGGPTREFRFLRNQLYRDKDVITHVWLQTAKEGADQESDVLLHEFPQTREGMFQYDGIIAFDPDWRELDAKQSELLERWVAEKAGGMLVVAGPVYTPEWTRRPRGDESIDKIRRLYPVSFYSQGSAVLKLGRFGGDKAFPLDFTREGRAAEYLWIGDSGSASEETWSQFAGVFGYYAVNEAKPGADILAYFADPSTSIDERLPIYLASHYYGAGRVFFQASGEMWRVRKLDVEYFQQYYTKLLRWISQGRLLRDSTRGVLLVDRERCWMGDQVSVQAILRNQQDEALAQPSVEAVILKPDGSSQNLILNDAKDSVRPGTFTASFPASLEGEYRISLPVPDSPELEVLTTQVQSNIPDLEKEKPQRNDQLLSEFASKTSGHYYVGMNEWNVNSTDPLSAVALIQPQDQVTYLPGTPDRMFQRKLMMWLLGLIVLALSLEWLTRRLHKLA